MARGGSHSRGGGGRGRPDQVLTLTPSHLGAAQRRARAKSRTIGLRAAPLEQLKVKCPEVTALMAVVEGFKLPGFSQLLYYSDFKP